MRHSISGHFSSVNTCIITLFFSILSSNVIDNDFDNCRGSCKGSFFCPVLQNCTSNDASCNAGRFMQLPCDAKCMNATAGKGVKPSKEDIQIFRLKCMDNEKYCPRSLGCVGSNDSCSGNRKLDVPLGDGPEDEQRTFCRMREYICPRYTSALNLAVADSRSSLIVLAYLSICQYYFPSHFAIAIFSSCLRLPLILLSTYSRCVVKFLYLSFKLIYSNIYLHLYALLH